MLNPPVYNQYDQRWRDDKLGDLGRTLGSDGCAMTCLGMYHGINPEETLNLMKSVGGIMPSGDMIWTKVPEAFPETYFRFRWSTVIEDRNSAFRKTLQEAYDSICSLLAVGQTVPVKTTHPNGGPHWVLAKGIIANDLLINDPDGGRDITYSSRFGNPLETIQAYVILIKQTDSFAENVPDNIKDSIIHGVGDALPKAAAIRQGRDVEVYSQELIDTIVF